MVMGCGRKYNGLWGESVTEHWGPHSWGSKGQQNFYVLYSFAFLLYYTINIRVIRMFQTLTTKIEKE